MVREVWCLGATRAALKASEQANAVLRAEQTLEKWDANFDRKVSFMSMFWRMGRAEYGIEATKCPGIAVLMYSTWGWGNWPPSLTFLHWILSNADFEFLTKFSEQSLVKHSLTGQSRLLLMTHVKPVKSGNMLHLVRLITP